jgi:arginine decarboxylase
MSVNENADIYNIDHWSNRYFSLNDRGDVAVNVKSAGNSCALPDIVKAALEQDLELPLLVRFPHILHDRVRLLSQAFASAIDYFEYQGSYTPIYPIKVNQQRRVVEEIVNGQLACLEPRRLGLEAGSKPELAAVLTQAGQAPATIVCNGYKDRDYIELALMAEKLGHKTYIVIEKSNELAHVLRIAEQLNVKPRIGVRARLASMGKGHWENTGGDKSKFGLTATEIMKLIDRLKAHDQLDSLQLLHFHLGSQIANIHDIQMGLLECTQFFVQLHHQGVAISTVDVGGGLGVDYEGTRSRSTCSMNYSIEEYARQVVRAFSQACLQHDLPHPTLLTESGRAVTAHHAVLIADVIDQEVKEGKVPEFEHNGDQPLLEALWECHQNLLAGEHAVMEIYHQISAIQEQAKQTFSIGQMSLDDRAKVEQFIVHLSLAIQQKLDPAKRSHRPVLDHLNEVLADKIFVNFSLFQSLPDVWALGQIFPVMPLTGLDKPIGRRGVIQDITCDSDGRIDQYVDDEGIESTLPLPLMVDGVSPLIGFFMVGAYQEILGDMHNLFGDTDSVDVYFDDAGVMKLKHAQRGDTMAKVLAYVDFNADVMQDRFRQQVAQSNLDPATREQFIEMFGNNFSKRTYLKSQ